MSIIITKQLIIIKYNTFIPINYAQIQAKKYEELKHVSGIYKFKKSCLIGS